MQTFPVDSKTDPGFPRSIRLGQDYVHKHKTRCSYKCSSTLCKYYSVVFFSIQSQDDHVVVGQYILNTIYDVNT